MRLNYTQIKDALAMREEFDGNSMRARYERTYLFTGRLPRVDTGWIQREMQEAHDAGIPFYVVYSYDTPIAWAWGRNVCIPDVHYSMTTTKQQTIVRAYLKP